MQIPPREEAPGLPGPSSGPGMDLSTVISGIKCMLTAYKWHSANDIILPCLSTCHRSPFLIFPPQCSGVNLTHAEKVPKMHWPGWISSNIMMRNT